MVGSKSEARKDDRVRGFGKGKDESPSRSEPESSEPPNYCIISYCPAPDGTLTADIEATTHLYSDVARRKRRRLMQVIVVFRHTGMQE